MVCRGGTAIGYSTETDTDTFPIPLYQMEAETMWTWGYITQQVIVGFGLLWSIYMLYATWRGIQEDERRARRKG